MKSYTHYLGLFFFFGFSVSMMAQKSQWEKVYLFTNDSLINKRRFEEAYTPCDENLKLAEKEFGKKHPNYAKSTLQLWTILYRINKLKEGISLLTDYLPILQKSRLKDSIYHGQTLNYLGLTHKKNNAKETAESFFLQAKEQCKKDFTLEYANALNNLGSLYYDIGRTDEAIEHLTKALSFASKETPSYFNRLANLGMVYQSKGRFKEALQIAHDMLLNTPKSDINYFNRLSNLSFLYARVKLYKKALEYIQQGYEVVKRNKGSLDYHLCLINMATYNLELGNYQEAQKFALEAVEHTEAQKTPYPNYDFGLALLADCYNSQSKTEEAMSLAQKALQQTALHKGKNSWDYFFCLGVLARIYEKKNQLPKAIEYYQEFLDAAKKTWSPTEDRYISTLKNLIPLYNSQNLTDKSTVLLKELAESMNTQVVYNLDVLDEYSKEIFINNFVKDYQPLLLSQIKNLPYTDTTLLKYAYEAELAIKGVVLGSTQLFRQISSKAQNSSDNETSPQAQYFKEWINLRDSISKAYTGKWEKIRVDSLNNRLVKLEERLISLIPEMKQLNRKPLLFDDVRSKLAPDACAIEFVHFKYFNNKGETDTVFYGALIVRPNKSYPEYVNLCTEKSLLDFMKISHTNFNLKRGLTRGDNDDNNNENPSKKERPKRLKSQNDIEGGELALYDLIWKPLQAYLDKENTSEKPIQSIHYTPTGLLHRVAFSALSLDQSTILSDKYDLYPLSSTRKLATPLASDNIFSDSKNPNAALLYGGIIYETETSNQVKPSGGWSYLKGTKKEVQEISKIFNLKKIQNELKEGSSATEEHFRALSSRANNRATSPLILHIATHGFFYQAKGTDSSHASVFKTADNPLFRSGLIMANANAAWRDNKQQEGKEDGILTAYEISNMDLSHTKLVVLSACETGLGDIQGTEGVYGLQRAFKMAGVEYILMSLWKVPDEETVELMTLFYTHLLNGDDIETSFAKAQRTVKIDNTPFNWAGFVLIR